MIKIITFGFSPFFILATDSFILIILNMMLQKYGGIAEGDLLISSATIIQSYLLLITGPLIGLTGGTQPILSYNYGARKIHRVRKLKIYCNICSLPYINYVFSTRFLAPQFIRFFTDNVLLSEVSLWGIKVSVPSCNSSIFPILFRRWFYSSWKNKNSFLFIGI